MAREEPYSTGEEVSWGDKDDVKAKICRKENPVRPSPVLPEQQLPNDTAARMTDIIKECWQTESSKRPKKFRPIEDKLQGMLSHDVNPLTTAEKNRFLGELRKLAGLPEQQP